MSVALERSGKTIGDAVLACLQDPDFRSQLDRISAERLAAAEHKLVDLLLRRLDGPDESVEKSALAIWQLLSDDKRRPAGRAEAGRATAPRSRRAIAGNAADNGQKAAKAAEEFNRLLEVIRKRLDAAERSTDPA